MIVIAGRKDIPSRWIPISRTSALAVFVLGQYRAPSRFRVDEVVNGVEVSFTDDTLGVIVIVLDFYDGNIRESSGIPNSEIGQVSGRANRRT